MYLFFHWISTTLSIDFLFVAVLIHSVRGVGNGFSNQKSSRNRPPDHWKTAGKSKQNLGFHLQGLLAPFLATRRPPKAAPRRPKTPQGRPRLGFGPRTAPPGTPFWHHFPTSLHHVFELPFGIKFSLILKTFWTPFGLHFQLLFQCVFAVREKCSTLRIYRPCRVNQGVGPSEIH